MFQTAFFVPPASIRWRVLLLSGAMALMAGCGEPMPATPPGRLEATPGRPQLLFVSVANDDTFHRVMVASAANPGAGAYPTSLSCERVYFSGHHGICLTPESGPPGATTRFADVFDDRFERTHRMTLAGEPSRVRVSPDGRLAASTVFESGHSYASAGFSTKTTVYDLTTGTILGDLEEYETRRDGRVVREDDFNFWGVTFAADSNTFYATLDTGGISYLVRGDVRRRTIEVIRPGVECPSLSPDNSRIAFKKRVGARSAGWWQIAVLRLDTMAETGITQETRSVDDQVEWLDDGHVVYHLTGGSTAADLWAVAVDDSSPPARLLAAAYSPAVVR